MAKFKDLTGQKFGRLTVLDRVGRTPKYETIWRTSCDCGNITDVTVCRLVQGKTKSCGCIAKEGIIARSTTHGMSHTSEHNSWMGMVQRSTTDNPEIHKVYYKDIPIEESWKTSFIAFMNHIGPKPKGDENYSIDRINTSKGYVEGNVRWATYSTQSRNKLIFKNNSSGANGISLTKVNRRGWEELRYVAVAYRLDGTRMSKTFSVLKYGLLPAFKLAFEARARMIVELNTQGAGYSENHGDRRKSYEQTN